MEAKKRAAKTARISLFNIQRPNQTLQRDSSPPLFHFLTGYFFWSDLDTQNLIFVFIFSQTGIWKQSREKEKWQNLFIHHPYTLTIHTETRHQHTVTQSLQISPPHIDPFHNFHSQRKLTHLTRSQTQIHKHTICVNSHLHTHVHKITSTHIHTPIYNSHAA